MRENTKVLFVIDNMNFGGAQKIMTFLANGLRLRGLKTAVCSYASGINHFEMHEGVEQFIGRGYTGGRWTRHLKKIGFISECVDQFRPDVIISFSIIPTILSMLSKHNKTPIVYCERGDPFQATSLKDKLIYRIAEKADWAVFQTEEARSYFSKGLGRKSSVIPNPVTVEHVSPCLVGERKKSIVSVGRFDIKQKRQDLLVEAFAIVQQSYPEWTLEFFGDGDDIGDVKALVSSKGLENKVVFHGKKSNIDSLIWDSGLFVLSSDYEGIPNALIEAMCAGLPVVSTNCSPGGAKLLIDNYENGILVDRGDSKQIAEAIDSIISNPSMAQNMGNNAQDIIHRFCPDVILDQWQEMVSNLVTYK